MGMKDHSGDFAKASVLHCIIYGLLSTASGTLLTLSVALSVPITSLFNKTSFETLGLNDGGKIFFTADNAAMLISMAVSLLFILPVMDLIGRKFTCVYVKFWITNVSAMFFLAAYFFQNSFIYVGGSAVAGLASILKGVGDATYLSEIANEKHKGYVGGTAQTLSISLMQLLTFILAQQTIFGNDEGWIYMVLIAVTMNIGMLFVGRALPDSVRPVTDSSTGHSNRIANYLRHLGRCATKRKRRKILCLTVTIHVINVASALVVEDSFPVQLLGLEGFSPQQVLTLHALAPLISCPYYVVAPLILDKWSKKTYFAAISSAVIFKGILHIVNLQMQSEYIIYANTIIQRLVSGTAPGVLPYLLLNEFAPRKDVVALGLISAIIGEFFTIPVYLWTPLIPASYMWALYVLLALLDAMAMFVGLSIWPKEGKYTSMEIQPLLEKQEVKTYF